MTGSFPSAVLKRWSCLSAPVAIRWDDGLSSGCCCHGSTDAARRFDDVGVWMIVGFDGADALSYLFLDNGKRHTWNSPYILLLILVVSFEIDAFVECFLLFEHAFNGPVVSAVGLPHVC